MKRFQSLVSVSTLAAMLIMSPAALAEVIALQSELAGQNEVPPNDATATGSAEAQFDTDSKVLSWTIIIDGLSGPVVGAHIHGPSEPSANAGIVLAFENPGQMPIAGEATLTDEQVEALLAGLYYVNIHTGKHPGGEVRGHLTVAE